MEASSVVWGLDIGHTSLKAVKLQRQGDAVQVVGYSIEPIPAGEDVDRDEAVVKALQTLAAREDMRTIPVIASLSGRQIFSRTIPVPVLNPKKIHKMVELEARQQIPGDLEDVRWSYHLSPSLDGTSNDVALFAARREICDDLIGKCKRAGIQLSGVSVTSIAVYNFISYDQDFDEDESVIVLDVGAENTDLVVYQGDTLWMRTLGVSGNDITRAFMKKFRVSFEEAETLKCQVADSKQSERILRVIEPNLAELVSDVQRSLGFYKSQNSQANFQNVVVSGNTFRLPGLTQFMADRLGYGIIELVDLERIKVAPGMDHDHFLEDLQSLGVAMGLGLQGLGVGKADVNLLPSSMRLQTVLRTKRWAAVVLLALIAVVWLIGYAVRAHRLETNYQIAQDIKARKEKVEEEIAQAKATAEQIIPLSKDINRYRHYGAHVGYLAGVEGAILRTVQEIAVDPAFIDPNYISDPDQEGDPTPQGVYLESIRIPDLPIGSGRTPFEQHLASRDVEIHVRVPAYFGPSKRDEVRNALRLKLEALLMSGEVFRVLHPGQDVPPPEERPKLFAQVTAPSESRRTEQWQWDNPFHRDDQGNTVGRTVEIPMPLYLLAYKCVLGGDHGATP